MDGFERVSADDRPGFPVASDPEGDRALEQAVIATEAEAAVIALHHIPTFPPFNVLPLEVKGRMVSDYQKIVETHKVGKRDMNCLLTEDIPKIQKALHLRFLTYQNVNSLRQAVFIHVAFVIGADTLLKLDDLWLAVKVNDFHKVSRILMTTNWPGAAPSTEEKNRIMDLADMMRDGMAPLSWMH